MSDHRLRVRGLILIYLVHFQQMDALDERQELTQLGHHLTVKGLILIYVVHF